MIIAITGANGQLGTQLQKFWKNSGHELICLDLPEFDITNKHNTINRLLTIRPDVIIHTAAFTDVDACEESEDSAFSVNATGTESVAEAAEKCGAFLVYISTDYVFDGRLRHPLKETDLSNPNGVYAVSKFIGELKSLENSRHCAILRTCGLYSSTGTNFVKKIVKKLKNSDPIYVVNDQTVSPTYVKDFSEAIDVVVKNKPEGIFHMANCGAVTWFNFARKIAEVMGINPIKINSISTVELNLKVNRPKYSALNSSKCHKELGYKFRTWDQALTDFLSNEVL